MMRTRICLLLLLFPLISFAQFKNIKLDETTSTNAVCSPGISINRKNTNNIVASSDRDNVYYTLDGGITWQRQKIASAAGVNENAALIADDKGNFFSFHLADPTGEGRKNEKSLDEIICHISKDEGKTWEEGGPIGLNAPKDQDKPSATLDTKGNIWVTWTQFDKYQSDDSTCQSNILLSSSSNGKKWSKPFQISQMPGDCKDDDNTVAGATAAVAPDGKAFVVWGSQGKIFMDRSFNGGGLWLSNDITIAQQPGGWKMNVAGHDHCYGTPVLMADQSKGAYKGRLYIVWSDQRKGENDTDVWLLASGNFGDNWSSPLKLGEGKNERHQYFPAMTVDQETGYLYIVYYDRAAYTDNQTDVWLTYSADGGGSFKNVKISEEPFAPVDSATFGDYINIAAHNGIITPIWTRVDEGKTSIWTAIIKQTDLIKPPELTSKKKNKK